MTKCVCILLFLTCLQFVLVLTAYGSGSYAPKINNLQGRSSYERGKAVFYGKAVGSKGACASCHSRFKRSKLQALARRNSLGSVITNCSKHPGTCRISSSNLQAVIRYLRKRYRVSG